jgi:hypothetical protein
MTCIIPRASSVESSVAAGVFCGTSHGIILVTSSAGTAKIAEWTTHRSMHSETVFSRYLNQPVFCRQKIDSDMELTGVRAKLTSEVDKVAMHEKTLQQQQERMKVWSLRHTLPDLSSPRAGLLGLTWHPFGTAVR